MRDRAPSVGPRRRLTAAAAVLLLLTTVWRLHAQADPDEVRALWVVRATLSSASSIAAMVETARSAGFNTLLVQVSDRAAAPPADSTSLSPAPASFDPVAEVVERAHEAGLRVHAWIDVTLLSSAVDLPLSREHVLYRHPEWLMVPQALAEDLVRVEPKSPEYLGRLARYARSQAGDVGGLYLSPATAAAVEHTVQSVRRIVERYAVDGVHLDDARFPGSEFDYSRDALAAFRRRVVNDLSAADQAKYDRQLSAEPMIYTEAFPGRWGAFRTERLTDLVARVHRAVKSVRPAAVVSASVAVDLNEALTARFQDWRGWLGRNLVDAVCLVASSADPMAIAQDVLAVVDVAGRRPVWAGIGAADLSQSDVVDRVRTARRLGAGVILFSYDTLTGPSRGTEYLAQLGRAAFIQ
jgi:uncharacterized lipoprotein YddW (UPF0748 family)